MSELIGQALLTCIRNMPPGQRMNLSAGRVAVWVDCSTPDKDILDALRQLLKLDNMQNGRAKDGR